MKHEKENLLGIVKRFSGKKILIIGDIMLDRYIIGSVDRISPEAPVPVVSVKDEREVLGGAANVANLLSEFNVDIRLCGVTGQDAWGDILMKRLSEIGVDDSLIVKKKDRPTTVKTRIVAHHQQVVRIDRENASPHNEESLNVIINYVKNIIHEIDAVIISDYGKGVITPFLIDNIVALCKEHGKIVSVDPKVEHFRQYRDVTLITPNNKEASEGIGIPIRDSESLLSAGRKIMDEINPEILLITRSEDGMAIFQKGADLIEMPTVARDVFDVTGAGDIVIAVYTLALTCGATPYQAALISNYAAGLEVQKFGCLPITYKELEETIRNE
ncbi:MAG: D-glycero-beta-D-manno-heptose-7-phosphate kinase [Spirochaetes bacterium]|nr:D-glycero-beta-D-manno-heptose-7-phosphate kinase [Spirochaetota bacterium]